MGTGEWEVRGEDMIICRCMEVAVKEVVEAIRLGADSFDAVKRVTRAGMGLCQGRTCQHLIERLITEETGLKTGELQPISIRPPLRPTALKNIAGMKT
ncbi:MAG: (2Fe-2S)-binding protein [Candidatus Bathyarchaeota archaeon]|nr:(2Fe-2S)-binding protein [Candidatus Bathyarchaeota archaeon]